MAIDTTAPPTSGLARWTRLGMLGQLFVVAGALTLLVAIVGFGLSAEGEQFFLLIVSGIALAGALAAWKLGTVGTVIGIVTALLTAMALFWTAFGLSAFPSFFDVLPGVLVIPGAILAAASYIAAIVAGRRDHRTTSATGGERTAIRAALALVGVVAIVTGALTVVGRSSSTRGPRTSRSRCRTSSSTRRPTGWSRARRCTSGTPTRSSTRSRSTTSISTSR